MRSQQHSMPQGAEAHIDKSRQPEPSRPNLRVIQGEEPPPDLDLPDEPDLSEVALARAQGLEPVPALLEGDVPDNPDLSEEALARAQGLEPIPVPSPEHNKATPESLINAPYLRAARDQLVSAWADLRKYEHGLIGAARGIVARKSKETAQARYDAAQHAYQQALREQAQEVEREFGIIEKAKALVYAMEQVTDARAERVLADMGSEKLRKLYQLWQKMGEMNVGNIDAVKNILARQEDDGAWKGKAKAVGRFIARGMSLRTAVGSAIVGSGFWAAYAGWRMASGAATGVGTYTLAREGMRVGSRELLKGSEAKVRREYGEAELASMSDQQLGEIMQAYGARLGFHGEKLSGNTRFERVKNAFLSRFVAVKENVEEREVAYEPDEEEVLEAVQARRDAMVNRLEELSSGVEEELAKKEKEDRRQRLIAAASALAMSGAIMYWRGGVGHHPAAPVHEVQVKPEVSAPHEIEMSPKLVHDALHGESVPGTTVAPTASAIEAPVAPAPLETPAVHAPVPPPVEAAHAAEAAVAPPVEAPPVADAAHAAAVEAVPAPVELPHGVAGVYEIKSGQGLLHAANEFQKAQHDEIVAGIKTQHPEWFAKGEDYAIHRWRMEQVTNHGGSIGAAGEKYTEMFHPGAKVQLEFDENGYPHLNTVEDAKLVSHFDQAHFRPRVPEAPKADLGFEKWGDNHPIRFSKEGVSGTLVPYGEDDLGGFTLDVRDIHVDDHAVSRFLDPNFKEAIQARMHLEGDPAALGVATEAAQTMAKDVAAREAALEYLKDNNLSTSAMAQELRREIDETIQKAHWRFEDARVFRPVSLPLSEEAGAAAGAPAVGGADADWEELQNIAEGKAVASDSITELLKRQAEIDPATVNPVELKFPLDWSAAQQEAARRVITYYQEIARSLENSVERYATGHAGDPLVEQLRERLSVAKAEALTDGEYSVQDMLKRMYNNKPDKIPTVELVAGTSTVVGSARAEAGSIFDGWLKAVKQEQPTS